MYSALMALGEGKIDPDDLRRMLYVSSQKAKAAAMQPSGLDLTKPEWDPGADLWRIAGTWEAVRNAVDLEVTEEQAAYYRTHMHVLVRLQSAMRGALLRARKRILERQNSTSVVTCAGLCGAGS